MLLLKPFYITATVISANNNTINDAACVCEEKEISVRDTKMRNA